VFVRVLDDSLAQGFWNLLSPLYPQLPRPRWRFRKYRRLVLWVVHSKMGQDTMAVAAGLDALDVRDFIYIVRRFKRA
jgi:hypothetical protein